MKDESRPRRAYRRRVNDVRGRVDLVRLRRHSPHLRMLRSVAAQASHRLAAKHASYTKKVSTPVMAVSLEAASVLEALIILEQPTLIADLGSGFSSYVVRQAPGSASAISVDDDPEWLQASRDFVAAELGDRSAEFVDLRTWRESDPSMRYDLIFHDMGSMEVRAETLDLVADRVAPGGLLLLDDVHKSEYGEMAHQLLHSRPFVTYDLRALTLDDMNRRCLLARAAML